MLLHQLSPAGEVQVILVFGTIITAVITTIGIVAVALINRTRQHAKAASDNTAETRDEFVNDHKTNLRDDLDAKFAGLNKRLDKQSRQIAALFARDRELAQEIEQTVPRTTHHRTQRRKST